MSIKGKKFTDDGWALWIDGDDIINRLCKRIPDFLTCLESDERKRAQSEGSVPKIFV